MTWPSAVSHLVRGGLAAALLLGIWTGGARAAAIVTTEGGSNQILVYPTPNAALPNPEAVAVSGVPAGARPHGVSCFDDTCLVADQGNFRVFVVRISTASVIDTISTAPVSYQGDGTLAVNPAKTFALAVDPFLFFTGGQLTVIAAPFTSSSAITTVPLSGPGATQGSNGTQAIAFQPDGRAFVCMGASIAVLNPPYTAIAFTLPLPALSGCSDLAFSPDGSTLFAPTKEVVNIFTTPFTPGASPATLSIPGARDLAGAAVTSDGAKVLVVDAGAPAVSPAVGPAVWAISAPFGGASAVEKISLLPAFTSFRQIAISSDDALAILAGGGDHNPNIAFIRPPFTGGGATVFDVFLLGGVGFGGVNILGPAGPVGPPPPPCGVIAATTLTLEAVLPPVPSVGTIPLVSALLPASRSVRVGCPATAFVTVINAGTETATGVGISLSTLIAAEFLYQTTDPATNALTGTPNTPVDIGPNAAQSFVIALTPRASLSPTDVAFSFGGANTAPVSPVVGLNTLLLSASTTPVPDVVALGATAGNTGIVKIAGPAGAGAFAVASVNVGLGAAIAVTADTGSATLPVTLTVCQTNPASGQCLAPPTPTVNTFIDSGATPTFAIFAQASGAISFDPAGHRVFVRFKDALAVTRGATSVAVTTDLP